MMPSKRLKSFDYSWGQFLKNVSLSKSHRDRYLKRLFCSEMAMLPFDKLFCLKKLQKSWGNSAMRRPKIEKLTPDSLNS